MAQKSCMKKAGTVLSFHVQLLVTSYVQIASYDARHTITTLCQHVRYNQNPEASPLHLYVYEEEPELLVRHLLLLSVLLDGHLLAKERMETLLEIHGNLLVREQTAKYIGKAIVHFVYFPTQHTTCLCIHSSPWSWVGLSFPNMAACTVKFHVRLLAAGPVSFLPNKVIVC